MPRKPNTALIYEKVPRHLQAIRVSARLTQRELAQRLAKPQSWVARCETAARRVDIAEWIEWVNACEISPVQALSELLRRRG